jgi:hypothetical protein
MTSAASEEAVIHALRECLGLHANMAETSPVCWLP